MNELSSDVTSLTVHEDDDSSTEVPVHNLEDSDSTAIVFTMTMRELSAEAKARLADGNYSWDGPQCAWFDRTEHQLRTEGCSRTEWNTTTNKVTCRCTHLTDFALYNQIKQNRDLMAKCRSTYPGIDQWPRDRLVIISNKVL